MVVEVPLCIVPGTSRDLPSYNTLVQMQQTLLEEERVTFLRSVSGPAGAHPIAQLHNAAVYQKALCRIFELGGAPLAQVLRERKAAVTESVRGLCRVRYSKVPNRLPDWKRSRRSYFKSSGRRGECERTSPHLAL